MVQALTSALKATSGITPRAPHRIPGSIVIEKPADSFAKITSSSDLVQSISSQVCTAESEA